MQVVHAGSVGFDALLYPEQSVTNLSYIQNQFQNFSNTISDVGRQFIAGAQQIFEEINNSETLQLARNAIRAAKGLFMPNVIMPLTTYDDFQVAQPIMQRYVMAYPDIRQLYFDQRCDGYSDTYVDLQPNVKGEDHYDYRRVMNGMVVEGEEEWELNFYPDDLHEGDRELNIHEQVDILSTWSIMRAFLDEKKDPTNVYGGKIG